MQVMIYNFALELDGLPVSDVQSGVRYLLSGTLSCVRYPELLCVQTLYRVYITTDCLTGTGLLPV